jgi:hypothetical protein
VLVDPPWGNGQGACRIRKLQSNDEKLKETTKNKINSKKQGIQNNKPS